MGMDYVTVVHDRLNNLYKYSLPNLRDVQFGLGLFPEHSLL